MVYQPLVELTRGGIVESLHTGALAIADTHGRLVASYGDPYLVTFLRSSAPRVTPCSASMARSVRCPVALSRANAVTAL